MNLESIIVQYELRNKRVKSVWEFQFGSIWLLKLAQYLELSLSQKDWLSNNCNPG